MKHAEHSNLPDTSSFLSLELREALLSNLTTLGYDSMTPIQAQSLPLLLKNQDIIAQAKTGSGKTVAFGLALLNQLEIENYRVQGLVLCPTRELAEQVSQTLRQLARLMPNVKVLNLSGGMPMKAQLDSLRHGAHIIVGTPGRVQKHLDKESLSLKRLKILILDEADRMLDMGFYDAMQNIIELCPKQRQTLMFSATYPAEIKKLAGEFMQSPKRLIVEEADTTLDIEQIFYEVNHTTNKFALLKKVLLHHKPSSALVFCNTKELTNQLVTQLSNVGFSATALNGDMDQVQRDLAIVRFKNQSCTILVATDVAARGIDIKELPAVINYELAFDHDVHIHRIGRTGRAGNKGLALSITTPADAEKICVIEEALKQSVTWGDETKLDADTKHSLIPDMVTLSISVGKKDKVRAGDIVGALTKDAGLDVNCLGKIDIGSLYSYVAVHRNKVDAAFNYLQQGKLKGRKLNVKKMK